MAHAMIRMEKLHSNGKHRQPGDLVTGMAAGVLADVAVTQVDKLLSRFVSEEQKRRERAVREGSPHKVGGRGLFPGV
jgi:hypothetical protein